MHATMPADTHPCEMYRDHGSSWPVITQAHHLRPEYLQDRLYGRTVHKETVSLCANCHTSLHAWLYWLMGEQRKPVDPPPRIIHAAFAALSWFRAEERRLAAAGRLGL